MSTATTWPSSWPTNRVSIDRLLHPQPELKAQQVGQEPVAGGVCVTSCRSEEGITVGLVDTIINSARLLSNRNLGGAAAEALRDMRSDSDVCGLFTSAPQPAPAQDVVGWISVNERLPNCGHAVLAYYLNRQGMGRRIRAEYVTRWTVEAEMFADPDTECVEYSELEDAYYVTEGWYELIDNWDEYARIAVNEGVVTNWMPLPAAPAHDRQSGGEE